MNSKSMCFILAVIILFSLFFILLFWHFHSHQISFKGKVIRIIDGDTFVIYIYNASKVYKVRLKCIDYPDLYPYKRKEKWLYHYNVNEKRLDFCYHEGISFLKNMLLNKNITLIQDSLYEKDKYGRLLGYIIYDGMDINKFLIEQGYAIPYRCYKYDRYFSYKGCLWNS